MKFRILLGFVGLKMMDIFPANGHRINLYQQELRSFFGRLYLFEAGSNINIQRHTSFSHRCKLGDYSGIGEGSTLYGPVDIGRYVMMGPNCTIYTQNHAFADTETPMCFQGSQSEKKVIIEDDVWIGGNVTILPGVHIHRGSIIGACAVVTKDVPEYSIVAGNPAVIVKYRKIDKQL